MARANSNHITNLSALIRDPFVRAAFEAAEWDGLGDMLPIGGEGGGRHD